MTIMSSRTRTFTIDQIVTLAYRKAALVSVHQDIKAAQRGYARDLLDLVAMNLESRGWTARSVQSESIALVAGQKQYSLSPDVLEVVADGYYTTSGTLTDIRASMILRDEYNRISTKDSEGMPVRFYQDRTTDTVSVWVWPVPGTTQAGSTMTFQCNLLRANSTDGSATPDAERHWTGYFTAALAKELAQASSKNPDFVGQLASEAEALYKMAKGKSNQRGSQTVHVAHGRRG